MDRLIPLIVFGCTIFILLACMQQKAEAASSESEEHGLSLSEMKVTITSQGKIATFQLYDTKAAKELYSQLPLTLELTNFRDAQWMFYPPKKLSVTAAEAYHDGKKGELSYYEPWGDAFMLYKDFYAGDEMHRLGVGLSGIDNIAAMSGTAVIQKMEPTDTRSDNIMQITVKANGNAIVFELNDSQAAKDLVAQLPLNIEVENYGGNEKIFYPPEKLKTSGTPLAKNVQAGTLAYYAPWGDVVLFYGSFGSAPGLYELGRATQGVEHIKELSGTIQIEK